MNNSLRSFLAIVLSMGVLVLWYTVIAPPPAPHAPQAEQPAIPVEQEDLPKKMDEPILSTPQGDEIVLENRFVQIKLNTDGGVVTDWTLKSYTRNGGGLVSLAEAGGRILETFFLDGEKPNFSVKARSQTEAELSAKTPTLAIAKRFRLKENSYQLEMDVEVKNLTGKTTSFRPAVGWGKQPVEESPQRGVLFFKTPPDRWHPVSESLAWMGAQSRYFLGTVMPVGAVGIALETGKDTPGDEASYFFQKLVLPAPQILPGERWVQKFLVYGGPKDYKRLKVVRPGLEKTLGLGWTTIVAVPMLYLLKFFYNLVHNYGVAIILLTILVKLLLNPINRKSLASMKGMQVIQPRLKELREKYGNDKQKLNQEMMQLFKNHKINPMGGCLPMLLQIPIYIALYKVLWSSVELYHAPFFWFYKDLSAPDPYLVTPLLLGATMFIQTKMTPTATVDPMQQKMMLIMPLMFCLFMVFLPMGLGLYILVNTLMTILQQWMYKKEIRMRDVVLGRVFRG